MRYKLLLLSGFFFGSVCISPAQPSDSLVAMECHYGNEIGVKVGAVRLTGLLSPFYSTSSRFIRTYTVDYKRKFGHNQAIRAGVSGNYLKEKRKDRAFPPNVYTHTRGVIQIRVGWEYNHYFSRRWSCFYGVDLLGQIKSTKKVRHNFYYDSDHPEAKSVKTQQSYRGGIGPLLGFEFAINQRISISTSMQLILFYGYEQDEDMIKDDGKILYQESGPKTQRIGADVLPFRSLMLNLHF